jgi:hypothetical protein
MSHINDMRKVAYKKVLHSDVRSASSGKTKPVRTYKISAKSKRAMDKTASRFHKALARLADK